MAFKLCFPSDSFGKKKKSVLSFFYVGFQCFIFMLLKQGHNFENSCGSRRFVADRVGLPYG